MSLYSYNMTVENLNLRGEIMFDNLSEIVKKGDNGDISAMMEFVKDNEIRLASKSEYDIKKKKTWLSSETR